MAPRRYDASGRPWRIGYWHHQNILSFILFAANVVAIVDPKARCLPGVQSETQGKLVGAQGEDPCVLAANVTEREECGDEGTWTLLPLDEMPGQVYPAPGTPGTAKPTRCSCSRVAYNLFSACAACQKKSGAQWVEYSVWNQSCEADGIDSSDFDYSDDPAFLSWMSISDQGVFSVNAAIATLPPTDGRNPLDVSKPPDPAVVPSAFIQPDDSAPASASVTESASVGVNTNHQNLVPLIVAPILSVSAVAALVGVWYYFYRRKRAKRVAPSAEFTKYQRTPIPLADVEGSGGAVGVGASVRGMRSIDNRPASYALQDNGEEADGEAPPAFTPGLFKDPIFEKGVAMSLANQSGTWTGRRGHTSDTMTTMGGAGVGGVGGGDVRTERQDSLGLAGGDSPASLSLLAHGQGQLQLEKQRLIPPAPDEERD